MKTILSEAARVPLAKQIEKSVLATPVVDIHTHIFDAAFKELLLWGIDDLLFCHYLIAVTFRYTNLPYEKFWALSKTAQADLVWDSLFIQHSPISEACRGVLTTLHLLGLDVKKRDLPALRQWFAGQRVEDHITRCMELAGLRKIYMTNSPFDDLERPVWEKGFTRDERFVAGLRVDPLILSWRETAPKLAGWGYHVHAGAPTQKTFSEVRRFLADWTKRMQARYVMVSLPDDFRFPAKNVATPLIEKAVLPHCRDLHIVGCWWFLNVPYLIDEMTRMRVELLGLSFTPQHSDARVLDQIIYKWNHSRQIIAQVLVEKYSALAQTGWQVGRAEIER